MLRAVAAERHAAMQKSDRRLELVWTGPERDATATRDTAVVVRELFQSAQRDVLVAGYALFNARPIFEPLADQMQARPSLRVRLFLNIARGDDMRSDDEITADFTRRFRTQHWPAGRLPEVYFDPRSLDRRADHRAVMHAKCVQVDDSRSFVTSANLTEAAQVRNIELGVVINDSVWCKGVRQQFDDLVARGELRRLV
jgi:phosphatidylserine/phosphatidylglycerophosphate/cardiolipin synthase-like enzyme